MSALLKLLPTLLGLLIGTLLFVQGERLSTRTKELVTAHDTIAALQNVNDLQAQALADYPKREQALRQQLAALSGELAALDQHNRSISDELERALATPPAGRPNCAREPLPAGALRLLKPTGGAGANPGGDTPSPGKPAPSLPGA